MNTIAALTRVAQPAIRKRCRKFGYKDTSRSEATIDRYISTPEWAKNSRQLGAQEEHESSLREFRSMDDVSSCRNCRNYRIRSRYVL